MDFKTANLQDMLFLIYTNIARAIDNQGKV